MSIKEHSEATIAMTSLRSAEFTFQIVSDHTGDSWYDTTLGGN